MFKAYIFSSALMLSLFTYAQFENWSMFGSDDGTGSGSRSSYGSSRSVSHK